MNLVEASRSVWASNIPPTLEQINSGSLQRIATSLEAVAQSYVELQRDRDLYKRWYAECQERARKLDRRNVALRGWLTRLKKRGVA